MTMFPYVLLTVVNSKVKEFYWQNETIKDKMTRDGSKSTFLLGMTIAFLSLNYHLIFLSVLR